MLSVCFLFRFGNYESRRTEKGLKKESSDKFSLRFFFSSPYHLKFNACFRKKKTKSKTDQPKKEPEEAQESRPAKKYGINQRNKRNKTRND